MNLVGLILCGGYSTRAGFDKGLYRFHGKLQVENCINLLGKFFPVVYISIREEQLDIYSSYFPQENLILDETTLNWKGPLRGILSAYLKRNQYDFFVLACDLLNMKSTYIEQLIQVYLEEKHYDFFMYKDEYHIQTLCGIYTRKGLENILFNNNPNNKLSEIINQYPVKYLNLKDKDMFFFKNYNYLVDYEQKTI